MSVVPANAQNSRPSNTRPSQGKGSGRSKQDPRDVQDKGYQRDAKQNLIAFFTEARYSHEISPKKLSSVSQKEFYQMFSFIIRHLDPTMPEDLPSGAESAEIVVSYLKHLRYPFLFPKSCLQAVGSPIYWPQVLAMLDWLVGQVVYLQAREKQQQLQSAQDGAENADMGPGFQQQHGLNHRMRLYAEGYMMYMSGDDEAEEFNAMLQARYAGVQNEAAAECSKIVQRIEELAASMQSIRNSPDTVLGLMQEIEELTAGNEETLQATADNEAASNELMEEVRRKQKELSHHEEALAALRAEAADLEAQVAAQPVQKEEVAELQSELAKLREQKRDRDEMTMRRSENKRAYEKAWAKGLKELESIALDFNAQLGDLKLVPSSNKRANGVQHALTVNHDGRTAEEILPVDLKSKVLPALTHVQEHYQNKKRLREQQLQFLRERVSDAQRTIAQLTASARPEQHSLEAIQTSIAENSSACERDVQAMYEQAASMQSEAHEMLESAERELSESKAACEHETQAFKNAQKAGQDSLGTLLRQVGAVLDQIISHKGRMKEMCEAFTRSAYGEAHRLQSIHAEADAALAGSVPVQAV